MLITNVLPTSAQDSTRIDSVAYRIGLFWHVHDEFVYRSGETTDQYRRFEFLCEHATETQLQHLMQDTSAAVRTYALAALAIRSSDSFVELFADAVKDTTRLLMTLGCVVDYRTVADASYTILRFRRDAFDTVSQRTNYESFELDSILLSYPLSMTLGYGAMSRDENFPTYKQLMVNAAVEHGWPFAIYLLHYHNIQEFDESIVAKLKSMYPDSLSSFQQSVFRNFDFPLKNDEIRSEIRRLGNRQRE